MERDSPVLMFANENAQDGDEEDEEVLGTGVGNYHRPSPFGGMTELTQSEKDLDDGEEGDVCYGELILLGYNGSVDSGRANSNGRRHRSKAVFKRREGGGNGVRKGCAVEISAPPKQSKAVQDYSRHVVSYAYHKAHTILVEYVSDPGTDMFQVGRSSEAQMDFTIVDTWLAAGSNNVQSPAGNSARLLRGAEQRPISSTISRYACRILADRSQPSKAYVYAAAFDASKTIFLGEKATKWQKKNGEADGFTTNGVLLLHPTHSGGGGSGEDGQAMYVWREVTVNGEIYSLRETRSSTQRGELIHDETNELTDGTLIDVCGATLLWRSAAGLRQTPSRRDLEYRLDELNRGKPQCPVSLNTLIIPRRRSARSTLPDRQPFVYENCGHVQGKHNWGIVQSPSSSSSSPSDHTSTTTTTTTTAFRCPICMTESERILQLTMGMEPAFHLDSAALDYAFNPCGHVCSLATVHYWSSVPLPHGTNSFYPVCPFCTSLLSSTKPYVRLIFQDHCFDSSPHTPSYHSH